MPLMEGLEVFSSPIHGYGVRASRLFRNGEFLLYGDGVLYKEDDDFDDTYSLIAPNYLGDPDADEGPSLYWDLTCQSRWINHSCRPNTYVDTRWDADRGMVVAWWEAIRDIEPGEELSYDYAFSGHLAEPCGCGSGQCRGLIVDPDELHLVPRELQHHLRGQLGGMGVRRASGA